MIVQNDFDRLPVEILHRIFDYLDTSTIQFSLRLISKRFYSICQTYNRYRWNFQSMCKENLRNICQNIDASNVISLTLSDDDRTRGQIEYFLRCCSMEKFTRLRSLNLIEIDPIHLEIFLNAIERLNLVDLFIELNRNRISSLSRLSSTIVHSTLKNLHLNILSDRFDWPMNENLNSIRLDSSISFVQFRRILEQSIQLKKLILKEIPNFDLQDKSIEQFYPQLISLTIEDCRIDIEKLERCLTLTPSLIELKLIGQGTLFDSSFNGYRWENLIEKKLRHLKTFEFFFTILIYSNYHSHHMNLLITPFRTSFWSKNIRCSIVCDHISQSRKILLYTLPICVNRFVFYSDYKKISLTNFTRSNDEQLMNNITTLEIPLNKQTTIVQKDPCRFHRVTSLTLTNDGEWPTNSLPFLSSIIDLSRIVQLSLSLSFVVDSMTNLVKHLQHLFDQTTNLRHLSLFDYWPVDNVYPRLETICSLISPHIQHLQIRVKNIDEIQFLLEHLENLTSVTFQYSQMLTIQRDQLIHSLESFQRYSSIWNSENALHIWLGKRKNFFFK